MKNKTKHFCSRNALTVPYGIHFWKLISWSEKKVIEIVCDENSNFYGLTLSSRVNSKMKSQLQQVSKFQLQPETIASLRVCLSKQLV